MSANRNDSPIKSCEPEHDNSCFMCGEFRAVHSMNKALNGEYFDIL